MIFFERKKSKFETNFEKTLFFNENIIWSKF